MEQSYDAPETQDQLEETPEDLQQFEDQEPAEPVMVRIRLNGRYLDLPEDQANAILEHDEKQRATIRRQGDELGQLRKQPREEPRKDEPPADDEAEFWVNPREYVSKQVARAKEEAARQFEETQERKERQARFWGKFYSDHDDLKDQERIVRFVVSEHYDEIKELDAPDAHKRIAELSREFLGTRTQGKPLRQGPVHTERPSAGNPPPPRPPQPRNPQGRYVGISAKLAADAEARRKATFTAAKEKAR